MRSWPARPPKASLLFLIVALFLAACGSVFPTEPVPELGALAGPTVQRDDGLVMVTSPSFATRTRRGGHSWQLETDTTGSAVVAALPDHGALRDARLSATSPRLDYRVRFVKAGNHYLWVYGQAAAKGGGGSLHVGLSGRALPTSRRVTGLSEEPGWTRLLMSGRKPRGVARIRIPRPGLYTLNVWMREDGVQLGALALTPDPDFRPDTLPAPLPNVSPAATRAADAFVDSVGVNTHLHYTDTVYNRFRELIKPKLLSLGVRHIRDGAYTYPGISGSSFYYARLRELAAAGVRFNLLTNIRTRHSETTDFSLLDDLYRWTDGATEAFEGVNEPDLQGVGDWAAQTRAAQRQLYETVKGDPSLRQVKVLGPSPVWEAAALGDLSSYLDLGNTHPYPGGLMPLGSAYGQSLKSNLVNAAKNSGSKAVVATETGYHNALGTTRTHPPVSEKTAAVYLPRLLLAYFNSGVSRTYLYELIDTWSDPTLKDPEAAFGLLRNDGSEKPAFVAVRTLLGLLSDPGPAFSPEPFRVAFTGETQDVQRTLLRKRDGTLYLALWLETPSWDRDARRTVPVAARTLTLQVGEAVGQTTRYRFGTDGRAPATTLELHEGQVGVAIDDRLTLIAFAPPADARR